MICPAEEESLNQHCYLTINYVCLWKNLEKKVFNIDNLVLVIEQSNTLFSIVKVAYIRTYSRKTKNLRNIHTIRSTSSLSHNKTKSNLQQEEHN